MKYDEFGLLHENAEEFGLAFDSAPAVRRVAVDVAPGRRVSALVWGVGDPEVVLLHGGGQNAHTWDTVALALRPRPLVAVDLPGHGHSDPPAGAMSPRVLAADVAATLRVLAPAAAGVVGMSLGGLVTVALAEAAPELVRRVMLVDVVPGLRGERARHITDFLAGPATFGDFDEILERTVRFNPTRSVSSLRRGILHNAVRLDDGRWVWRHARWRLDSPGSGLAGAEDVVGEDLTDALGSIRVPVLLARGMRPDSVLGDDDEATFRRLQPGGRVVRFADAGHSIQGDMPVELAAAIGEFVPSTAER